MKSFDQLPFANALRPHRLAALIQSILHHGGRLVHYASKGMVIEDLSLA